MYVYVCTYTASSSAAFRMADELADSLKLGFELATSRYNSPALPPELSCANQIECD